MPKIVKYTEFKKVVDALWEKSKEVYEHIWNMCTYLEKDKASLSKDNVFVGKNTFNEVMLTGKTVFNQTSTIPDSVIYGTGRYCGYRVISTHNNAPTPLTPKYVSAIKIRVLDNLNVGDIVDGVHVVEVEKRADKLNDIVGKTIADGSSFIVEEDAEYQRCIYVPVEKEYSNDTYFLIAQSGTGQFRQIRFDHLPNHVQESINGLVIEQLPAEGQPLNHDRGVGWVVLHGLTSNTIDVRKTVNSINNKVDRSEVGNSAGQIPQIDGSGRLDTSIMPDIAITSVEYANSDQEMMNKNVQVGDIIVAGHESNSTYMCKDTNAQNKNDKFIKINMGYPVVKNINGHAPDPTGAITINGTQINVDGQVTSPTIAEELDKCVKSVNGEPPRLGGNVTINAGQISGIYNQSAGTVQAHLNTIKNSIDSASNRIATLERKVPPIRVGELIQTFAYNGDSYSQGGVEYIWLGKQNNLVQRAKYPDLFDAFGLASGTNAFNLPHIADQSVQFDYGRSRYRKTYIVAKIS